MFQSRRKNFIYALATFAGTIIGVGFFGLPYVASKAGFFPVLGYFVIISLITLTINLLFGQVVLINQKLKQFPGYCEKYLGKWGKHTAFIIFSLGLIGTLLSYLIIGGEFLYNLFAPLLGGSELLYILLFFIVGSWFIFKGARTVARIELIMLFLFFLLIILFFADGFKLVNYDHFLTIDYKFLFLPYGVIIFSLWGTAVIPEIKEILDKDAHQLNKVLTGGLLIAAAFYLIFIFVVLGISGEATSEEAIMGLKAFLGNKIIIFSFIFGFLACFTSFLALGLTLKKVFWYDYKIPNHFSTLMAVGIPLALYFLGLKSFIPIISLTGAILLALQGILIFLIYIKARDECRRSPIYQLRLPEAVKYLFVLLLIVGIVFEMVYLFIQKL